MVAVRRGAPAGECGGGNEAALSRRFYGSDRSKLHQGTSNLLHLDGIHFQRREVQACRESIQKDDALLGVSLAVALCKGPPDHHGRAVGSRLGAKLRVLGHDLDVDSRRVLVVRVIAPPLGTNESPFIGKLNKARRRTYVSLRIPESVARRVYIRRTGGDYTASGN